MSENPFSTMSARLAGELLDRQSMAARALKFHQAFLDDYLRGILPHDLILIGAPSGMGKTDLALSIAASNAAGGKRVGYFALEAEPRELERRTKYALLSRLAWLNSHPQRSDLNYTDWLLGKCEHIVGEYNRQADQKILNELGGLWTYYRGIKFDHDDLRREFLRIAPLVDMIVIDHLHYVDSKDDENETSGLGATVKAIRDTSLIVGKPVILVAHLRKRNPMMKQLVAHRDDFHGSSNIVKICTQAITIERAHVVEASKWYLSPTFIAIQKDRRSGECPFVAVQNFDKRTRSYKPTYTLGLLKKGGTEWEQLGPGDRPGWAVHHEHMQEAA